MQKAEWLSEEALQIAVKRKGTKSNEERERYSHLNAEFQRIARKDKKAFFNEWCLFVYIFNEWCLIIGENNKH